MALAPPCGLRERKPWRRPWPVRARGKCALRRPRSQLLDSRRPSLPYLVNRSGSAAPAVETGYVAALSAILAAAVPAGGRCLVQDASVLSYADLKISMKGRDDNLLFVANAVLEKELLNSIEAKS